MNQIIKTTVAEIGGEEQQTVNARELWKVLGSKRQFGNWIKERLSDFIEGQDFAVNKIVNGKNRGRFASMEYYITLDVAKHLAMLERNEIGKKVRQYLQTLSPQMESKALNLEGLVTLNGTKPVTTSLRIAEVFGKKHCDVLRAIESLEIPEDFRKRNFASSGYQAQNGLGKTVNYKMYLITRDGFTLLAMGFTGKRAMQFKLAYINAFNEMERRLQNPSAKDVLCHVIGTRGAEWIIERLQKCEILENYAPQTEFGSFDPHGLIRGTVRRGCNPIRGGRKIQDLIVRAQHPDLFEIYTINKLKMEIEHGKNAHD